MLNYFRNTFKYLRGMCLATDVILLVLSLVYNHLIIYVFVTGVGCEVTFLGSSELNNVPYISAKVSSTMSFSHKETWMLGLKIWMLKLLGVSKYLT